MEIGVDIVSVKRIQKALNLENFKNRVFTENEIRYCEARKNVYQSFAARFAAKEAFVKALGTGFTKEVSFLDIEVVKKDNRPYILYKDKLYKLSLSHEKEYAVAMVILEIL